MLAGAVGLVLSLLFYAVATGLEAFWPRPLSLFPLSLIIGIALFGISIAEIPVMVFGIRQMAKSAPPLLSLLLAGFYVAFGSVYAALMLFLTGAREWGSALAALCLARFISLLWARSR